MASPAVDIATVMFDLDREPPAAPVPEPWAPRPEPSSADLVAGAARDAATGAVGVARGAVGAARRPGDAVGTARSALEGVRTLAESRIRPAPETPYNRTVGPHRRFTWVRGSLDEFKRIKNSLGGTLNDVVLAAMTGALRRHLRRRGEAVPDELKAMVPVSTRADAERGALGNRVTTIYAPLPTGIRGPAARLAKVSESMAGLKESGQAVGAQVLTELTGFAPPTVMAQAARQAGSSRLFNVTITNVPGPQFPLYMGGRELLDLFPMVPLAPEHGLGVAIMSYNGRINFGLVGDWDLLWDIEDLAPGPRRVDRRARRGGRHRPRGRGRRRARPGGQRLTRGRALTAPPPEERFARSGSSRPSSPPPTAGRRRAGAQLRTCGGQPPGRKLSSSSRPLEPETSIASTGPTPRA